ncbi:MAG: peptidoglycan-binding protein, partial [Proteobacteria bacterium]|nr:peptidoglycan-binding protein [Pseudomonadota bacterium]
MLPSPKNLLTSYMPRGPSSEDDTGSGGWFDLEDWVGPQHPSKRGDVAKLEGILANAGDYSLERTQGPTGYWGLALDDGIRKYQKRNGLKTDGILRPGGPTIEHMRENFGALLDGHEPPTPDDIDAHHEV